MILALILATVAVYAGAALALHSQQAWIGAVQTLSSIAVVLIVFLHLLPEAWEMSGVWGALWAAIGFLVPQGVHRLLHLDHDHRGALAVAWAGLVLHAVGDGVGLVLFSGERTHHDHDHHDVVFALALHRLPVAAFIAAEVHKRHSRPLAWAAVTALALATLLGAGTASSLDPQQVDAALGPVTGLTTGLLLHILAHRHHGEALHPPHPSSPPGEPHV